MGDGSGWSDKGAVSNRFAALRLAFVGGRVLDELLALPLKLAGADASPVRAILRTLP